MGGMTLRGNSVIFVETAMSFVPTLTRILRVNPRGLPSSQCQASSFLSLRARRKRTVPSCTLHDSGVRFIGSVSRKRTIPAQLPPASASSFGKFSTSTISRSPSPTAAVLA